MRHGKPAILLALWSFTRILTDGGASLAADPITPATWTEKAGFKPDLSLLKVPKGTLVDKSNVSQVEALLTKSMKLLIEKYALSLKIRDYKPIHPSLGYIAATNQHRGKAKVLDIGNETRKVGLGGYVAGLPFPDPQNGSEVGWNYQYSYNGDDGDLYYDVLWVSASKGVEHTEEWRWAFIFRTLNRTDIPPVPELPGFREKNLQYTSITYALAPYDKKGFGALYSRSVDPLDQQGHIYVPAMRRVLRNTFGTRGDTWNATDMLYEDVRGLMAYPEWMHYKLLGKKTMLMPMHCGSKYGKTSVEANYDLKTWPHWNPRCEYEPRPVYEVELKPKFSDYPYSRMVIYVDAESYLIVYKESYDKKGQLWKTVFVPWNESPDMNKLPPLIGPCVVMDLQAEHATIANFKQVIVNTNLDPKMFTLANLRKRST